MFLGAVARCFGLKQFVGDCAGHCTHCTGLRGRQSELSSVFRGWRTAILWDRLVFCEQWFLALFIWYAGRCRGMKFDVQSRCRNNMLRFDLFEQTGAALHLALCRIVQICAIAHLKEGVRRWALEYGFTHFTHNGKNH
jgi:hypothetical protein